MTSLQIDAAFVTHRTLELEHNSNKIDIAVDKNGQSVSYDVRTANRIY